MIFRACLAAHSVNKFSDALLNSPLLIFAGGHINPAVTFGMLIARKVSFVKAVAYMIAQCLGAICGAGLVKAIMKHPYNMLGGGANSVSPGYSKASALGAEIIGTFILLLTVFAATDEANTAQKPFISVRSYDLFS